MQAAILQVILCRCGAPMKQEFLGALMKREATVLLWCENPGCTQGNYKRKRFKLTLPTVQLEEVPYAPRDEADFMQTLNKMITPR